jgi:hypothetical protein
VHAREEHVEHDDVIRALAGAPQAVVAVVLDVHVEPLGDQAVGDRGGQMFLVLYDQYAHR